MAKSIRRLNFPVERLRTGTPPRIDINTIDFSKLEYEESDKEPQFFSFLHEFQKFKPVNPLIKCYITQTNKEIHDLIESYRDELPVQKNPNGIDIPGPRYCPAIEKKL